MATKKTTGSEPVYVYQFHWQTMAFLGKKEARQNPMDKLNYILPANSTFEKPPGNESGWNKMKWNGTKWEKPELKEKKETGNKTGKAKSTGGGSGGSKSGGRGRPKKDESVD